MIRLRKWKYITQIPDLFKIGTYYLTYSKSEALYFLAFLESTEK